MEPGNKFWMNQKNSKERCCREETNPTSNRETPVSRTIGGRNITHPTLRYSITTGITHWRDNATNFIPIRLTASQKDAVVTYLPGKRHSVGSTQWYRPPQQTKNQKQTHCFRGELLAPLKLVQERFQSGSNILQGCVKPRMDNYCPPRIQE